MSVGGSTITQQLAKNLYLSPRRSLVRKLRELLIAFALEDHLTKQRILELYLNIVEWGDGVFGAEAAARRWFHHPAHSLTPAEAVRLAIALPNPTARAPDVRDAELTRKAVRLLRLLRMQGLIDAGQERTALDEVGAPDERVLPDRATATRPPPPDSAAASAPAPGAPEPPPEPAPDPAPAPTAPAPTAPAPTAPAEPAAPAAPGILPDAPAQPGER
jgi:monofunctional biosynthetic peptidoglycan transglycosylase